MSLWAMIFLVCIAGMAFAAWKHQHDAKYGILRDDAGNVTRISDDHSREMQNEIEELRERVKVLERIATDPARRTAEEIERLRDQD